ncbi:fluoride efflux transporter FluC [Paenibacillus mendelii]|uniref:Fluoride-specific ion channel FluC n=1 Tax=Paenibacillus mendelii TaxID=206163 RepID=A0ABV6J4U5_9BACL|nr:CrcB family protein [Paenibacillus mendelii]MCQ6560400.1 CrcB family protein [Paenibacillus mendelii]
MITVILIALGGAIGSVARYGIGRLAQSRGFRPYLATWVINAIGSLLIGLLAGVYDHDTHKTSYLFLAVGVLGGFTTFSTYMVQIVNLARQRSYREASRYGAGTLAVGILLAALGYVVALRCLN